MSRLGIYNIFDHIFPFLRINKYSYFNLLCSNSINRFDGALRRIELQPSPYYFFCFRPFLLKSDGFGGDSPAPFELDTINCRYVHTFANICVTLKAQEERKKSNRKERKYHQAMLPHV